MENQTEEQRILTPLRAIRKKCLDCSAGSPNEVRCCEILDCPLYPYRLGKSPNRKPRELTEDQREVLRQRMEKAREKRMAAE